MKRNDKIKNKKIFLAGAFLLVFILSIFFIWAADSVSVVKTQYFSPSSAGTFDSSYSNLMSGVSGRGASNSQEEYFDFAVTIPPLGCQPYVVRSDLLEEQNVPVFCQLVPLKVNPGIDITRLERVSVVQKENNPYISGVGFHPALSAVKSSITNQFSNPTTDNLGYVVVVLKRNENEKTMPDNVTATLAIQLQYGANYAYGIGETEYYLPVMTDSEFSNNIEDYSFYDGIGYLRVEDLDENGATISVYDTYGQATSGLRRVFSDRIEIGKVSRDFYLYNYMGGQGIRLSLKEVTSPETKAKIKINGQSFEVYKGGKFYNGKCTLNDVQALPGKTGSVKVSCNGKTFDLYKKFNEVKLSVGGSDSLSYAIGQEIMGLSNLDLNYRYFLIYVGQESTKPFILIAKFKSEEINKYSVTELGTKLTSLNNEIDRAIKEKGIINSNKLDSLIQKETFGYYSYLKLTKIPSPSSVSIDGTIVQVNSMLAQDASLGSSGANSASEYFNFAKESYDYVKGNFGSESASNILGVVGSQASYNAGEYSLWKEYQMAKDLNQHESVKMILSRIENEYPNSIWNGQSAHGLLNSQELLSPEGSIAYDDKNDLSVELVSIEEPSNEEASVYLSYNNKPAQNYYKGSIISDDKNKITLKSFDENKVYLEYSCQSSTSTSPKSDSISGNGNFLIPDCNARINVNKINLKKVAHVQIIPITYGRSRESNFTFSIGIEKRALALNLTPQEADSKIKDLNKEIAEWKNITESLGEFIKVEKAACLATTGVINLINLVSGASGEATARQQVMKKWNSICSQIGTQYRKQGETVEDCIANNYDQYIKKEIEQTQKIMADYNKLYEDQSKNTANQDSKGNVNDTRVKETIRGQTVSKIPGIQFYDSNGAKVECKTAYSGAASVSCESYTQTILDSKNIQYMSYDELSSLYYNLQMATNNNIDEDSRKSYSAAAYTTLKQIEDRSQVRYQTEQGLGDIGLTFANIDSFVASKDTKEILYTGQKFKELPDSIQTALKTVESDPKIVDGSNRISIAKFAGNSFYIYIWSGSENNLYPLGIYKIKDKNTAVKLVNEKNEIVAEETLKKEAENVKNIRPTISDANSYKNKCLNCNEAKVFVTEPYKGMPALLPFDCNEGWYVQTKQLLTGLGGSSQKTYFDSGKLNSFWLCNVGKNGLLEGVGIGDDKCTRFDMTTGNTLDNIGGLTQTQAKAKVAQAINAIERAQSDLSRNPTTIDSGTCKNLKVKNSEGDMGSKCTDFMSPSQCQLIFNVCDPVVCPSSRCDLGGTYKVDNVIQSGIIGSTFLCLPNFIGFHPKTGVVIPVCLTGINAGIENWISILEAYRDCINESVTNNRTVGICDAVHSVYVCDFFWKQAGPIAQAITKNLFYAFFGKGDHGGGEYLFVNDAWNNAEKSVQYFQTMYGDDSNLKFGFKDISNAVADEVCKVSASAAYPDSFDAMLNPESPVQFTAFFEEMSYTDATYLPRSQYKVTYHIFAGNEQGHYYQVYLKSAPTSLGYAGKDMSVVASGYVAQGGKVSETRDFIDVSGFKELCVRIDAQDKCGFKSVSTDAALNYAKDAAVSNEATSKVSSENDCISGTANLGALLTPNLQQAATELVNPQIYNQGIIRVCANENPGKSVNPARWSDVGYCDDKAIRCWLDTESVKKAIKAKGVENYTLQEIQNLSIQNLIEQQGYLPLDVAQTKIKELRTVYLQIANSIGKDNPKGKYKGTEKDVKDISYEGRTMDNLDEDVRTLDNLLVMSSQRVQLYSVKAEVYNEAAVKTRAYTLSTETKPSTPSGNSGSSSGSGTSTSSVSYDESNHRIDVNVVSSSGISTLAFNIDKTILYYGAKNTDPNDKIGTISGSSANQVVNLNAVLTSKVLGSDAEAVSALINGKKLSSFTKLSSNSASTDEENVIMLAKMITGEESTQGEEAMTAAGWVAINRLNKNSAEFGGNTLTGVLTKSGAFSGYRSDGSFSDSAQSIAQQIWNDKNNVPSNYAGYLFFINVKDTAAKTLDDINSIFQEDCDMTQDQDYKQIDETTMFISQEYCAEAHDYVSS